YVTAVSTDGSFIAYADNVAGGTSGDLVVDRADHGGPHKVATGIDLNNCFPVLGFVGSRFVASHCPANQMVAAVTSYDPATGNPVDLLTNASNAWTADVGGTHVLVKNMTNVGFVVPPGGGSPKQIDTSFG